MWRRLRDGGGGGDTSTDVYFDEINRQNTADQEATGKTLPSGFKNSTILLVQSMKSAVQVAIIEDWSENFVCSVGTEGK